MSKNPQLYSCLFLSQMPGRLFLSLPSIFRFFPPGSEVDNSSAFSTTNILRLRCVVDYYTVEIPVSHFAPRHWEIQSSYVVAALGASEEDKE